MVIKFEFAYMDLEEAPKQKLGSCRADYLEMRDGKLSTDPLVGGQRYCGKTTQFNPVYSTTNKVYAYFHSDVSTNGEGFAVKWTATEPPKDRFNCDFEESNDVCLGWEQDKDDDFDWRLNHGRTTSGLETSTGPITDHTKKTELGYYAYIEASGQKKGYKAVLRTPRARVSHASGHCFKFWYHMRGTSMGVLNVYQETIVARKNITTELLFTQTGDLGIDWKRAMFNVSSEFRVQFVFEGIRGSSFRSDMAIDDITLSKGPCPKWVATTTTTTTTTAPTTTRRTTRRPRPTTRSTTTTPKTTKPPPPPPPTTTQSTAKTEKCAGMYTCRERGNCIRFEFFCDGIQDCLHNDDEENCGEETTTTTTAGPVSPEWTPWNSWTTCDKSCGGGTTERKRKCDNGISDNFLGCYGAAEEAMECNTHKCIAWVAWQSWTKCTEKCGGGLHTRYRECDGGKPGELGCEGPSSEYDTCNAHNCPKYGKWSQWGACEATCQTGVARRQRACEGGQIGEKGCRGKSNETRECTRDELPPCADWKEWSEFGSCSVTCGGGKATRTRDCVGKGGQVSDACKGDAVESKECNTDVCAEWTDWSEFGDCSVTCGGGNTTRTRDCMANGAKVNEVCEGNATETQECNIEACLVPPMWTEWGNWSECSRSCAGGRSSRLRQCLAGDEVSTACPGRKSQVRRCNRKKCPGWREWNQWQSCSRTCGGGTQERRRSCDGGPPNTPGCMGPEIETQNCNEQSCDTTTQQPQTQPTQAPQTTRQQQRGPRWGNYGPWGVCSKTCGKGIMLRSRECIGGKPGKRGCRGSKVEKAECDAGQCDYTTQATTRATVAPSGPIWSDWSDWETCSAACGPGTTSRSRVCIGAKRRRKCKGPKSEKRTCAIKACEVVTVDIPEVTCLERNVRVARRKGRRCPLACSSNAECDSGKKCVCDGLCGKTCQDTTKRCTNILASSPEGTVRSCSNGIYVGSKCSYSCHDGYKLEGESVIFCQGTSKWTNQKSLPRCTATTKSVSPPAQSCKFKLGIHDSCCGSVSYSSKKSRCCNGKARAAGPAMTECCGTTPYDPSKKGCCGTRLFTTSTRKCRGGRIVKL